MYIILVGSGKTAYFLAQQFISEGHEIVIICPDADEAQALARQCEALVLHGDGSKSKLLEEAGARKASAVVALLPEDEDNLVACQLASRKFGVPRTIALIHDPANEDIFEKLGVSVTVSTARIMTQLIDEQIEFKEIISLIPLLEGRLTLSEVILPEDAPAVGITLHDLVIPEEALIASILRDDALIIPRGKTTLQAQDRIFILSRPEAQAEILRFLLGDA